MTIVAPGAWAQDARFAGEPDAFADARRDRVPSVADLAREPSPARA
jgi:hypothetical protein